MIDLDFSFEQTPWEAFLSGIKTYSTVSAVNLLALLEREDEAAAEDAFNLMSENNLTIDMTGFPKATGTGQAALRLREEEQFVKSGMHVHMLDENDPLRLFLEELARTPVFGDEDILAQESASGDENAQLRLANLGLSRVISLAKEFTGYGVLLMDLIQEGSLGLWQGIQTYKTGEYPDHRDRWIRNALGRAVLVQAVSNGLGQKMRISMQDYRSVDEKLLSEFGRNPTLDEIAAQMHITREDAEIIKQMLDNAYLLQQAEKAAQPPEEQPEDEQAVEDTAYFQMRQRIEELLSQLPKQQAQILTLRFGLDKGIPMTPEQTGKQLGLTVQEVTEGEIAALSLLRKDK